MNNYSDMKQRTFNYSMKNTNSLQKVLQEMSDRKKRNKLETYALESSLGQRKNTKDIDEGDQLKRIFKSRKCPKHLKKK